MKRKTALARGGVLLILFLSITTFAFSQNNFKVTGKVFDENGKPIEGATVQVKGTTIATATIADGSYSLTAPSGSSRLVITSIGYSQLEIAINDKSVVNISIENLASSLQDVVVIGYATVKRKDVTGAVGKISEQDIKSRPVD